MSSVLKEHKFDLATRLTEWTDAPFPTLAMSESRSNLFVDRKD